MDDNYESIKVQVFFKSRSQAIDWFSTTNGSGFLFNHLDGSIEVLKVIECEEPAARHLDLQALDLQRSKNSNVEVFVTRYSGKE